MTLVSRREKGMSRILNPESFGEASKYSNHCTYLSRLLRKSVNPRRFNNYRKNQFSLENDTFQILVDFKKN